MNKAPAFQFYTGDWRKDTQVQMANMETRGVWAEMLFCMWDSPERGKLTGTIEEISRLLGCTINELSRSLVVIERLKIADVTSGHNEVTVINRRMFREQKVRDDARLRKQKQRSNPSGHEKVTPLSSSSTSSSTSNLKELPPADLQDKKSKHFKDQIKDDDHLVRLNDMGNELTELKPDFNWWQMIQRYWNTKTHPEALIDVLGVIKGYIVTGTLKKTPYAIANKVMPIKSQSYNINDARRAHEAIKNQIEADPEIKKMAARLFNKSM